MPGSEITATKKPVDKKALEVVDGQPKRVNQFARNNPKLAQMLEEHGAKDPDKMREDIAAVLDMCLNKIVGTTDPDKMNNPEFLGLMASMETHKAKIAKLRADTESVLINVATPTAIRNLFNDYGMCIRRANENAVGELLAEARTEKERDLIQECGMRIYQATIDEIKRKGYEDESLSRLLSAPR